MSHPVNHKIFIQSLTPVERIQLRKKSDGAALRHLCVHGLLIAALVILIAIEVSIWPLLLLPCGISLAFLFTLQHECTHQTPFKTLWLNEAFGMLAGLLIVQPFYWFRYFHLAHHRYTNDPHRDPELINNSKPETWPEYLLHVSAVYYWTGKIKLLLNNAFSSELDSFIPRHALPQIRWEARAHIVIYSILVLLSLLVSPILIWIWLIPLALGFPFLRVYLLAEHGRCPTVESMFDNTRTTYTNRLIRFLAWNMPYHVEHHVLPTVPFHRLPAFHARTQEYLVQTAQSYTAFTRDYIATLE